MINQQDLDALDFEKSGGLIPAIVQDAASLRVLMLGYMNREAAQKTLESGFVTFFSRAKQRLWQKGEESGNTLHLIDAQIDCDKDTLLIRAEPKGPTCHRGTTSCFDSGDERADISVLADLAKTIHDRRENAPEGSYTAKLFADGITRIAQKVGEEGVETALAAATRDPALAGEAADLLYHLLVLLEACAVPLEDVLKVLRTRAQNK